MMRTVYIETSVVSYLVSRPSRDLIVAAHQEITREWWDKRREAFRLVASQAVVAEAGAGDPDAARRRLEIIQYLDIIEIVPAATALAREILRTHAMPPVAVEDALHVAVAASYGADFLLTWNCKHIANAVIRDRIEAVCRANGMTVPLLCTPLELLEDPDGLA